MALVLVGSGWQGGHNATATGFTISSISVSNGADKVLVAFPMFRDAGSIVEAGTLVFNTSEGLSRASDGVTAALARSLTGSAEAWYRINPSQTTNQSLVTTTAASEDYNDALNFIYELTGAHQTDPIGDVAINTGNGSTAWSVTITPEASDSAIFVALAVVNGNRTLAFGAGQGITQLHNLGTGTTTTDVEGLTGIKASGGAGVADTISGTISVGSVWAVVAIEVKAATGGVTGSGALLADPAMVSGAGDSASAGTGDLETADSTLSGAGTATSTGSGALTSQAAALDGTGSVLTPGAGAPAAGAASLAGVGAVTSVGIGALVADDALVVGLNTTEGFGALLAGESDIVGSGDSASVGIGDLVAAASRVRGGDASVLANNLRSALRRAVREDLRAPLR